MSDTAKGILAGYDGSPGSEQALAWAAAEARARAMDLTVCHAWSTGNLGLPARSAGAEDTRRYAETVLTDGLHYAEERIGSGEVRPLLANGPAARVLCEQGRNAAMIVIGSRGSGGFAGLLLGSVSLQVAAHASGPVVVVRGHARPVPGHMPGPVVVGADGSAASRGAVAFAFEEAALREVPLYAICALADTAALLGGARQVEADFGKLLATYQLGYPGVTVHRVVPPGAPRGTLLETAEQVRAQLLVVGARGRGGLPGMTLGSVSLAVLHHAPCPVSVIHQP